MKFDIKHTFPLKINEFALLYFDDEHNKFLDDNLNISRRHLISSEENGRFVERKYIVYPDRKIPSWLKPFIDDKKICYSEHRIFDKKTNVLKYSAGPELLKGKIVCSGECSLLPCGNNKCVREIKGELTVSIPVIGGLAEKFIMAEAGKAFKLVAQLTKEYISKKYDNAR